jgi:hypothetical protein
LAHNKLQFNELVHCTSEGIGRISNCLILPPLLTGQSWGQPSARKVTPVGDDEEDEAKSAINALTACLAEITDLAAPSVVPPATVATTSDDFDGLDLDGIATTSQLIPCKIGTSTLEPATKDTPLNKKLCDRIKLANLGCDRLAESLHLSTLNENGEWLYRCTD